MGANVPDVLQGGNSGFPLQTSPHQQFCDIASIQHVQRLFLPGTFDCHTFLLRFQANFKGPGVNQATLMAHTKLKENWPISNPLSVLSMI